MKKRILTLSLSALLSAGMLAGCNMDDNGKENSEGMQLNRVDYDRNDDRTRINQYGFTPIWGNGRTYYNQGPYGQPYPQQNAQPNAQQPTDNTTMSEVEEKVIQLTNQERARNGLTPLKDSNKLAQVAQKKSNDMSKNGYFSHNSPNYGSPFQMMQRFGVTYRSAAENIAAGQQSPEQVVQDWMNSPGHRQNIMNGQLTHIGVGHTKGGQQGQYWTQMFIQK